ncbi:MAG: enhanced serine sensitivity protein SseB [Vampirovibrio sp.]|nr:enhanced serine sensitivity protein SseB [Vampirovibrio sp.]
MIDWLTRLFHQVKSKVCFWQQQPTSLNTQTQNIHELDLPGERLEKLMAEVTAACFSADAEHQEPNDQPNPLADLYKALMASSILVPTNEPEENSGKSSETEMEPQEASLLTLINNSGQAGIPVFTSLKSWELWADPNAGYVILPFRFLCQQAVKKGVDSLLINIAGPVGCEIKTYEMTYLADGMIPKGHMDRHHGFEIEEDTEIQISKLDEPLPDTLQERLTGLFHQHQALVETAYAFHVSIAEGPYHLALGIRMPDHQAEQWETHLLPNAMAVAQEVMGAREYLDIFFLNQSGDIDQVLKDHIEPFFKAQHQSL